MRSFLSGAFTSAAAVMLTAFSLQAEAAQIFNRVATFHVADNLPQDVDPKQSTAAEIVTATEDGMMLVYTDSPGKRVGFIDIVDFKAPKGAGTLAMEGEPTSAVVVGGRALVGVVTSSAKDKPSGVLAVVDLARNRWRPSAISAASLILSP